MKALTLKEFRFFIKADLNGFTDHEVEIYYSYYVMGRKSVRW